MIGFLPYDIQLEIIAWLFKNNRLRIKLHKMVDSDGKIGEFKTMTSHFSSPHSPEWYELYSFGTYKVGNQIYHKCNTYHPTSDPNIVWKDYMKNHIKYTYPEDPDITWYKIVKRYSINTYK